LIPFNRDQITARRRLAETRSSSAKNGHEKRSGLGKKREPERRNELEKRNAAEKTVSLRRSRTTGVRADG
jgi:hypothetical protein